MQRKTKFELRFKTHRCPKQGTLIHVPHHPNFHKVMSSSYCVPAIPATVNFPPNVTSAPALTTTGVGWSCISLIFTGELPSVKERTKRLKRYQNKQSNEIQSCRTQLGNRFLERQHRKLRKLQIYSKCSSFKPLHIMLKSFVNPSLGKLFCTVVSRQGFT